MNWIPIATRIALGVAGLALLVTGVVAVFLSDNGPGTAALFAVGALLVAFGALWDQIETLRLGEAEIRLRQASRLLKASEEASAKGELERAEELRVAALDILEEAQPVGRDYEHIRRAHRSGARRTALMSQQMQLARDLARQRTPTKADVDELFKKGSDGDRITALAFIQVAPETGDIDQLATAIKESRSAYEQWQSLRAAEAMLPQFNRDERAQMAARLKEAREASPYLVPGTDRARLLDRILRQIESLDAERDDR
jgi:hypothetical protein